MGEGSEGCDVGKGMFERSGLFDEGERRKSVEASEGALKENRNEELTFPFPDLQFLNCSSNIQTI